MQKAPFGKAPFHYLIRGLASVFSERTKKVKAGIFISLLITLLMAGLMVLRLSLLENLDEKLYDYSFYFRGPLRPPPSIVIAAIDEKSIQRFGRWPWSRDKLASLVDKLSAAGAELIVFDIIFSEDEANDPSLGQAMKIAGNVILPVVFDFEGKKAINEDDLLITSAFSSVSDPERFSNYPPISAQGVLMPVPTLAKEAMALGHINMFPDEDGSLRSESLVIGYNGYLYPSISLKTSAIYLGIPPEKVVVKATEGIQLGKRYVPTDKWGRAMIFYYGPNGTFTHLSISDILDGLVKTETLQGKIVLIGATAVGIYDLRVTPLSPAMTGIEKQANVIASMLESRFLRSATLSTNIMILFIAGVVFSLLITRLRALSASVVTVIFMIGTAFCGYRIFIQEGTWFKIVYPILNFLTIFVNVTVYNYAVEERYARRIRAMFSSYVTEKIVNELIKNPDMAKLGGDRREVTVLFSDVRGFTSFSEKHSPEQVVSILNEYLGEMTDIVFKWDGTLDKFIGDAILAFWGAPMKQDNHAELAVKCALNMTKKLSELHEKWKAEGKPLLDAGIGINTGDVIVGNIGAEGKKMDYTVIGDHVNLGSRIESLTRKYNTHILISEFTLDKVRALISSGKIYSVNVKGLEKVIVKGKEKPVEIYEIDALREGAESKITEIREENIIRLKEK
ncbi:MAG: CHASE2 domain-containing protein [Dissulfurispiraceae bacterium]